MKGAGHIVALCAALLASGVTAQESADDQAFDAATDAVRNHDFARAITLFLPLAEQDMTDAQFNLAVLYKLGRGYPQNYGEAYYWGALAVLGDEAKAADLVDELAGVLPPKERDAMIAKITARLTTQIEAGDELATRKLARLFMELVDEPDYPQAYLWFSICYALGDNACKEGRDSAAGELEPEALSAAQEKTAATFAASAFARAAPQN